MAVTGIFSTNGGIASVNRLVIRSFVENGCRIEVFALGEKEFQVPDYAAAQVHYRTFHGNKAAFMWALWQAQASRKHDLVFCDHVNVAAALSPARLFLKRPYVVWVHGAEVFPPNPSWEGRIGLELAAKRIASSKFTRDIILQTSRTQPTVDCDLALEPDRWGMSLPEKPPMPDRTRIDLWSIDEQQRPLGDRLILHVGRMSARQRHKGHEVLLRAFPHILRAHPDAQLVLAGTGDDYAYLKGVGLSLTPHARQAIFMPGYVSDEDLTRLYQNCRMFALPSQAEGFGIVYMEAMRWARPCIGSRIDAASCVIADGQTGLLVDDPQDIEEVAVKINWLLAHRAEADRMGESGYSLVRKHHLFPEFKKRFAEALNI